MDSQKYSNPLPAQDKLDRMHYLARLVAHEAAEINADASEIVSAAMSIIGSVALQTQGNNRRACVQSLRALADMIESGELHQDSRLVLATAKAACLH